MAGTIESVGSNMARKATKKRTAVTRKVASPTAEEKSRMDKETANWALLPSIHTALMVLEFSKDFGEQDLPTLINELGETSRTVADGDLGRVEDMLVMQAHSLQAIFTNLSHRAINTAYVPQLQTYMNLALKAQAQCRCTLEALAEIKYPKSPTFVRQQNVGYQQQVNNSSSGSGITQDVCEPARTGDAANQSNELLETKAHERLDTGKADTSGGTDTQLEALGEVYRSAK